MINASDRRGTCCYRLCKTDQSLVIGGRTRMSANESLFVRRKAAAAFKHGILAELSACVSR